MNIYELMIEGMPRPLPLGATNRTEARACAKTISENNPGERVCIIENSYRWQYWLDGREVAR